MTLPIAAETQLGATPWLVIGWSALAVGIISALPIAVYFYFRRGRRMSPQLGARARDGHRADDVLVADFVLAWTFGIAFQYSSIVPMREDIGRLQGIWAAIKADTLSIVAFQIGLFGYMALYHLVFWQPPLSVASPTYWFMMQVGMVVGFFTDWPVNAWLVKRGWKEKM